MPGDQGDYAAIDAGRPRSGNRGQIAAVVIAFLVGLAAMAYLLAHWQRAAAFFHVAPVAAVAPPTTVGAPASAPALAISPVANPATVNALDARVAELEGRIARVGAHAEAASGNAARAEGLLIAFAARRALDRGMALGYIEAQLRERFAAAQPRAVATIIAASRTPVTLEELQVGLDDLAPALASDGTQGWWASVRREVAGLVVVRKVGSPSPAPGERLRRARRLLEGGRVDAALAEVARMPGRDKAQNWIAAARRYNSARQALDVIETSAILEPAAVAPPPLLPEPIDPIAR